MKGRLSFGWLILALAVLFGCQTMSSYPKSGSVSTEDRKPIPFGQHTESWQGKDLAVNYQYSRNESEMVLSGTVIFADHMTYNFSQLRDFQLSAVFTDNNGKVLGTHGIATERGKIEAFPFRTRLTPPGGTSEISFSYQGTALSSGDETGGGGSSYFWQYPIH